MTSYLIVKDKLTSIKTRQYCIEGWPESKIEELKESVRARAGYEVDFSIRHSAGVANLVTIH